MKPWRIAILLMAVSAATGCRVDPAVVLLERENRLQEDRIFELEGMIEDYEFELASLRRENDGLTESQRGHSDGEASPPRIDSPPEKPGTLDVQGPPLIEAPSDPVLDPGYQESEFPPNSEAPPYEPPATGTLDLGTPANEGGDGNFVEPILPLSRQSDSRRVERIELAELFSGGYDRDGQEGHEGIRVVIEPVDGMGRAVDAPADISVVVLDPALEGEAQRVARWDYTTEEVAAIAGRSDMSGCLSLEMAWPKGPPENEELRLAVRYTTADGRRLESQQPIRVVLPSSSSIGWAPSERRDDVGRDDDRQATRSLSAPLPQSSWSSSSRRAATAPLSEPRTPEPRAAASGVARPTWSPTRR